MQSSIAPDILPHAPMDPLVKEGLETRQGFSGAYLEKRNARHGELIHEQLGRVGIALEMSRPESIDPVVGIHEEEPVTLDQADFRQTYERVRRSPLAKLDHDTSLVEELLLKLGPTNPLRNKEGFDGGTDIGSLADWLHKDYESVPEGVKRPEYRRVEGLLREELALLWRPTTPKKFDQHPNSAFMFDLEDPNLFTPEEVEALSDAERWKKIGVKLSEEAATVFEDIYNSPTAPHQDRLEVLCRMTDMKIRSLRLQVSIVGKAEKKSLYEQIDTLNADYMAKLATVWHDPAVKQGLRKGPFFELVVVGRERQKLIERNDNNHMVRLALPREDQVHEDVPNLHSRNDVLVTLSTDVVVEDINGHFVQGYQAKAMTPEDYAQKRAEMEQEKGSALIHDPGRTQMRFPTDYENPAGDSSIDPRSLISVKR